MARGRLGPKLPSRLARKRIAELQKDIGGSSHISKEAQSFIQRKIKRLRDEGVPQDQAVGRAFSEARRKGFKIPTRPKKAKRMRAMA